MFVLIAQLKSKVMQAGERVFLPRRRDNLSIHFVLPCFSALSGAVPDSSDTAAMGTTASDLQSLLFKSGKNEK